MRILIILLAMLTMSSVCVCVEVCVGVWSGKLCCVQVTDSVCININASPSTLLPLTSSWVSRLG